MNTKIFKLVLKETYYENGFFNVKIEASDFIRNDNGLIKIYLGQSTLPIKAKVNRNANNNKTPRISGGAILKAWIQRNFKLGDTVIVEIIDPFTLRMGQNLTQKPVISNDDISVPIKLKDKSSDRNEYNNFQRLGSVSNSRVGNDFEEIAKLFFKSRGIELVRKYSLAIGVNENKKKHIFDLGNEKDKVIVECKSHQWTKTEKTPSAKMTVWNEAMYYFFLAPKEYRKIFFVLRSLHSIKNVTLAEYYLRRYPHLIAPDVEIWEYDESLGTAAVIFKNYLL